MLPLKDVTPLIKKIKYERKGIEYFDEDGYRWFNLDQIKRFYSPLKTTYGVPKAGTLQESIPRHALRQCIVNERKYYFVCLTGIYSSYKGASKEKLVFLYDFLIRNTPVKFQADYQSLVKQYFTRDINSQRDILSYIVEIFLMYPQVLILYTNSSKMITFNPNIIVCHEGKIVGIWAVYDKILPTTFHNIRKAHENGIKAEIVYKHEFEKKMRSILSYLNLLDEEYATEIEPT